MTFRSFILIFLFLCFSVQAQSFDEIKARIEHSIQENQIQITGIAVNQSFTHHELNYLLIVIKKGGVTNNLSNNKQGGRFAIGPSETKGLSQININLDQGDAIKAYLYIRDEQDRNLVSKDSLEINQSQFNPVQQETRIRRSSELSGLAIDETKSKVGKDFYDIFYMEFNRLPDNTSAVTIEEQPARGSSGQVNIKIDDRIIYGFMTNPSDEFLREQVGIALRYINDYNAKKKLIKNEFQY